MTTKTRLLHPVWLARLRAGKADPKYETNEHADLRPNITHAITITSSGVSVDARAVARRWLGEDGGTWAASLALPWIVRTRPGPGRHLSGVFQGLA